MGVWDGVTAQRTWETCSFWTALERTCGVCWLIEYDLYQRAAEEVLQVSCPEMTL